MGTLRADLTGQVLRLGPTWTSRERSGEISGVLVGGLDSIEEYVTQFLPARWLAMIVPLLVLLLVLVLDPPSVLVLLFTGPLLLLLLVVIGGRTRVVSERRFMEMRTLSAFFLDILRGIATLKMFGRSREQVGNLRHISGRYGDATMDVLRTAFQTSLVLEWGATIAIALVAVEIGLRLLEGTIEFPRALAVLLIVPEFFLPLRALAARFHVGTAGRAVITRTFEILDEPTPTQPVATDEIGAAEGLAEPAVTEPPRITFEGVRFTYPGREAPALDGATFELRPGESVALVGASGAGKSTVSSTLLRFIDPDGGAISVDGRPLEAYPRAAWRAAVAWVPQRPHLFDGSIADNIRLARPGASDEAVAAAARAANADEFIERLPRGFDNGRRRGRSPPLGRAAPARGHRPRLPARRTRAHPRRGHVAPGRGQRDRHRRRARCGWSPGGPCCSSPIACAWRGAPTGWSCSRRGRVVEQGTPAALLAADGAYRRLVRDFGEDEEVDA